MRLRAARPDLFRHGADVPSRSAARWHATLTDRATRLPPARGDWTKTCIALAVDVRRGWRCVLSGTRLAAAGTLPVADVLAAWPVALLDAD